jgi:hypothetical protein
VKAQSRYFDHVFSTSGKTHVRPGAQSAKANFRT